MVLVTQNPEETQRPRMLSDAEIFGLLAQTGCFVFLAVIASVLAGIWLDRVLNTRPLFTLLLVLGGSPFTLYALYRFALRAAARTRQNPPRSAAKGTRVDDDE
jgi:F0F1-type ATP synthase assembly protein I